MQPSTLRDASEQISIPYGSIKSDGKPPVSCRFYRFQFLMVQLKVSSNPFQKHIFLFQFLMVQLKVVRYSLEQGRNTTFQFLMVQLKGSQTACQEQRKCISIPYGSIKSRQRMIDIFAVGQFQFLMVQLKVHIWKFITRISIFQFLMVQLKGKSAFREEHAYQHFNSLWFN